MGVPMVILKYSKKNSVHRQHTNQEKRNHTKWIEREHLVSLEGLRLEGGNHTKWIESVLASPMLPVVEARTAESHKVD